MYCYTVEFVFMFTPNAKFISKIVLNSVLENEVVCHLPSTTICHLPKTNLGTSVQERWAASLGAASLFAPRLAAARLSAAALVPPGSASTVVVDEGLSLLRERISPVKDSVG